MISIIVNNIISLQFYLIILEVFFNSSVQFQIETETNFQIIKYLR